jgi:carbamoyl-phosphate synthase large subunit
LLALSVGAFGIGVTEFAPMGLLPVIANDLGVSIPVAGLLISAYALGVMLGAPGEVMGIDRDFATAFAKSQLGAGTVLPSSGTLFVSVKDSDKPVVLPGVQILADLGFSIIATGGTADYLEAKGIAVERVNKVAQGRPHIVDRIQDGDVALIFNSTEGWQSLKDSASIRATAMAQKIPYFTTAPASVATARAIAALSGQALDVCPLQSYYSHSHN